MRRAEKNNELYKVRNRKEARQFDRWWSGLLVTKVERGWMLHAGNKGLIHNGRKP